MNVTPHISRAGTAPEGLPARPSDSSPADFLLGTSPAGGSPDFKAIAAAWFGDAQPAAGKAENVAPQTTKSADTSADTSTKPAAGQVPDRPETRKNRTEDPRDLASALGIYPQSTLPFNVPEPVVPRTAGELSEMPGLPHTGTLLGQKSAALGSAAPGSVVPGSAIAGAVIAGSPLPGSVTPVSTAASRWESAGNEWNKDGKPFATPGAESKQLSALPGRSSKILGPSAAGPDSQKEVAVEIGGWNKMVSNPGNNNASIRPQTTGEEKPTKDQTTSTNARGAPTASATQSPVTLAVEPTPDALASAATTSATVASAKEALKSSIVEKNLAQTASPSPGVVARSRGASGRTPASVASKMKDRDNKETDPFGGQTGKAGDLRAGQIGGGSTNSPAGNGKDVLGLAAPQSGAHGKPAPLKTADDSSSAAGAADSDAPEDGPAVATSTPVTTARLVQSMSQSEFRVGMQTREFGSIDIRTSVARHMFSAQISVEHSDVAKSLTTDLPSLYNKLADQQVAVANIVIHGQGLGTSSGLAQDAQPQNSRPQNQGDAKSIVETVLPGALEQQLDPAGRLDIRI